MPRRNIATIEYPTTREVYHLSGMRGISQEDYKIIERNFKKEDFNLNYSKLEGKIILTEEGDNSLLMEDRAGRNIKFTETEILTKNCSDTNGWKPIRNLFTIASYLQKEGYLEIPKINQEKA